MPGNPTSHHGGAGGGNTGGNSMRRDHQREIIGNETPSVRDETHTMHAIPMIPNEEHDYGSRNFNQRDTNSINPVSSTSGKHI